MRKFSLNLKDKVLLNNCQSRTGYSFQSQKAQESPKANQKLWASTAQIARQLSLWESPQQNPENFAPKKRQKPQISSVPGTSPKQRDRYRVVCRDQILGDRLSIEQALELAKTGSSQFNHPAK